VAVEVMRLGARGERQGKGEDGGLRYCGLRPSNKACVNSIDCRRNTSDGIGARLIPGHVARPRYVRHLGPARPDSRRPVIVLPP
jgi:hypothetical protein